MAEGYSLNEIAGMYHVNAEDLRKHAVIGKVHAMVFDKDRGPLYSVEGVKQVLRRAHLSPDVLEEKLAVK